MTVECVRSGWDDGNDVHTMSWGIHGAAVGDLSPAFFKTASVIERVRILIVSQSSKLANLPHDHTYHSIEKPWPLGTPGVT
jgi:hypothetical protein